MLRYDALRAHLAGLPGPKVTLSYAEIESLIGRRLPPTAYGSSWRQWWANTESHSQALAWMRAGWRVSRPDLGNMCVEFRRVMGGEGIGSRHPSTAAEAAGDGSPIVLTRSQLTPSTVRMIEDAAEETGGDVGKALAEMLNRASMARRSQLLDWFSENAPRGGTSSVVLIREDRDAG